MRRTLTAAALAVVMRASCASDDAQDLNVPLTEGDVPEQLPTPSKLIREPARESFSSPWSRPTSRFAHLLSSSESARKPDIELSDRYYSRSDKDLLPAASSDYGSYASESGYGHSCSSGYVNASAVALLAFLFLLNLVQDIIQEVTAENARRKRSFEEERLETINFLSQNTLDTLKEGLPPIVIPLMVKLSDTKRTKCALLPMCEANEKLVGSFGSAGKVVANLLSNILSHSFSNRDESSFNLVQEAAFLGRTGGGCAGFEDCSLKLNNSL